MNKRLLVCLVLIAVMVCEVPAFSATFGETRNKAQKGDAQAQYDLAMMYYKGEGTKKNLSEAFKWWLKAAQQGHAEAQCVVGNLYDNGEGVKQNRKEAFKWWLKSAQNGSLIAQNMLATFYEVGYEEAGIKPNKAEAEKWRKKAAEPRNNLSQSEKLTQAINYYFGQGVPKDREKAIKILTGLAEEGFDSAQATLGNFCYDEGNYDEAFKWLTKAAEHNNIVAQYKLSVMYRNGKGVAQNYQEADKWYRKAAAQNPDLLRTLEGAEKTLADAKQTVDNANRFVEASNYYSGSGGLKQDKAKAVKIFTELANNGDANSQFMLGLYYSGEKNYSEAVKWYRKSAEQGYILAQNNLGIMYEDGNGVKKDLTEAAKWYRKAAEHGDSNAMFNIGSMYMNGEGMKHDKHEAFKWYMKAAENDNINAYYNVGLMYYNGEGVKKDYAKAAEWYRKAADYGIQNAQISLGVMYFVGEGVRKNYDEAYRLWKMAQDQGDTRASELIQYYRSAKDAQRKKAKAEADLKAARNAKRKKTTSGSNGDFVQGLQTVSDVLSLVSDIASIFSGRMTTVSTTSAPPRRVTSPRTGKTYTARTTPLGNCPNCFGDGMCHSCMWSFASKENWCRVCGGSAKCQRCHGDGYI